MPKAESWEPLLRSLEQFSDDFMNECLEDYAVARVDELEQPQHHREHFTAGY